MGMDDQTKEVYVPAGLAAAGLVLSFVQLNLAGAHSIGALGVAVLIVSAVNVVITFIGLLIAAKVANLALGMPLPAICKTAAVALFPGAVAGLVGFYLGGIVSLAVSLAIICVLLMVLFDMDFQEAKIAIAIVSISRVVAGVVIALAVFSQR